MKRALANTAGRIKDNAVLREIVTRVGYTISGFVLAKGSVFGGMTPFGLSAMASMPFGARCIELSLGAIIGYLTMWNDVQSFRYLATAVVIFGAKMIFHSVSELDRAGFFWPIVTGAVCLTTGVADVLDRSLSNNAMILAGCECVLAGAAVVAIKTALPAVIPTGEKVMYDRSHISVRVSLSAMAVIAATSLARVPVFELSLGRMVGVVLIIYLATREGPGIGFPIGIIVGAALAMEAGGMYILIAAYGFGGLIAGLLRRAGRLVAVTGFCIAVSGIGLFFDEVRLANIVLEAVICGAGVVVTSLLLERRATDEIPEIEDEEAIRFVEERPSISNSDEGQPGAIRGFIRSIREKPGKRKNGEVDPPLAPGDATRAYRGADMAGPSHVRAGVRSISRALSSISDNLRQTAANYTNLGDVSSIYAVVTDRVCMRCSERKNCLGNGYGDLMNAYNDATGTLAERGRIFPSELPEPIKSVCSKKDELARTISSEYMRFVAERRRRNAEGSGVASVAGQYGNLALAFEEFAEEITALGDPMPAIEKKVDGYLEKAGAEVIDVSAFIGKNGGIRIEAGISKLSGMSLKSADMCSYLEKLTGRRFDNIFIEPFCGEYKLYMNEGERFEMSFDKCITAKSGNKVSGDSFKAFRAGAGRYVMLISDGMGAGPEAQRDSEFAVDELETLIKAGIRKETALAILSSAILSRSGEGGFATIDALFFDLYSGEAEFLKAGAAPSFIISRGRVYSVFHNTLPCGIIEGSGFGKSRCRLMDGDLVIMASDGVFDADDDGDWLIEAVNEAKARGIPLSKHIVEITRREKSGKRDDDMTCVSVTINKRKSAETKE